ncbi:MAG TPA: 5'/3'-nucleotidase SurE [Vicinamibacterales bacterium]|nr:5'/3'-nucleotidase SurE [Vicinamibacterales bacterium]
MRQILVTNDDGVRSEGLRALADALAPLGDVTIVAPAKEASAVGHALTLHFPLRLEQVGPRTYAVEGTPTDCVNIGVAVVLKRLPDLVVSGINKGWNLGDDVTYSGTVSGALEGALLGVPSIAISLKRTRDGMDFSDAARAAARIAERVLADGLPPRTFLNVNVPRRVTHGFKVTRQATRTHVTAITERADPKHRPYYWIDEAQDDWEADEDCDYQAVKAGYISVTPLQPDLTAHRALASVERLLSAPRGRRAGGGGKGLAAVSGRKSLGKKRRIG